MPTSGLAAFVRESLAAASEAIELGRDGLSQVAAYSHRRVIGDSPVADPDAPGSGRLRASWTMARGEPLEVFKALPGRGQLPPPPEAETKAVADAVKLGDEIFIANGSPCVSTVNDRTSFVDAAIAATQGMAEELAGKLSSRIVSGARAAVRARP